MHDTNVLNGDTAKEVPITISKSQKEARWNLEKKFAGSFSPKNITEGLIGPPQGQNMILP